jgi:hypothetical protein
MRTLRTAFVFLIMASSVQAFMFELLAVSTQPAASTRAPAAGASISELRTSGAPALSPSDTQNHNTNTHPRGSIEGSTRVSTASPSVSAGRNSPGLVMGGSISHTPRQSVSSEGTPNEIDTLMGGEPLTETDDKGMTRYYPVFVKSDGTQLPVSAEYLRAMRIEWPPPAPVQQQQDLEAIAAELYQQAVANSQQKQKPANRSTHAPTATSSNERSRAGGAGGTSSRDNVEHNVAVSTSDSRSHGVSETQGGSGARTREQDWRDDASPPFSPRGRGSNLSHR